MIRIAAGSRTVVSAGGPPQPTQMENSMNIGMIASVVLSLFLAGALST